MAIDTDYPSFTIVIPSFNQGKFIERTILSILKQDYPGRVEIIVSDGGSNDETVSILKKYNDSITWWSEPDKGFVDACNKGFKKATGDIYAIQSSDDFYLKDAFLKVAATFSMNPGISLVCGSEILIEPDGRAKKGMSLLPEINVKTFLLDNWWVGITQHTTFLRKEYFNKVKGLTYPYNPVSEQDLFYRIIRIKPGVFINDIIGAYQLHDNQMTRISDKWEQALLFLVEHSHYDSGYNFKPSLDEKKMYEDFIRIFFLDRKDPQNARKYAESIKNETLIPQKTLHIINKYFENANIHKKYQIFSSVISLIKYGFLTKHLYKLLKGRKTTNGKVIKEPDYDLLQYVNWWNELNYDERKN